MSAIKRTLSLLLCLVLFAAVLPHGARAESDPAKVPKILLSSETAKPGEDVSVSVELAENPGIMAMIFGISYDPAKLTLIGAAGVGLTGWDVSGERLLWLGERDNSFNGTILKLNFHVLENAPSGAVSVTLTCKYGDICNHDEKAFLPDITAGSITIQSGGMTGGDAVPEPAQPSEPVQPSEPPVQPEPERQGLPFTDVYPSTYYYTAVIWAYQNGVTNGRSADTFDPSGTCNRGEVVTFLWRAAGCPEPAGLDNPFTDVKEGDYFFKPVLWAVEKGIVRGTDATHFSPRGTCTTAHILTFLYRALGIGSDGWYRAAGDWANGSGLLTDTGLLVDTAENCPRSAVVTFLYRWSLRR